MRLFVTDYLLWLQNWLEVALKREQPTNGMQRTALPRLA
jgi:hypothetical protein